MNNLNEVPEEDYKEYISHVSALLDLGKKMDRPFLLIDSFGNIVGSSNDFSAVETLFVSAIVRRNGLEAIIRDALKHSEMVKRDAPELIKKMQDEEANSSAQCVVNKLLRENGFKVDE